jgi:hypothetical protein
LMVDKFFSSIGNYQFQSMPGVVLSMVEESHEFRECVGLTRHRVDKAVLAVPVNYLEEISISSPRCRCDWATQVHVYTV